MTHNRGVAFAVGMVILTILAILWHICAFCWRCWQGVRAGARRAGEWFTIGLLLAFFAVLYLIFPEVDELEME